MPSGFLSAFMVWRNPPDAAAKGGSGDAELSLQTREQINKIRQMNEILRAVDAILADASSAGAPRLRRGDAERGRTGGRVDHRGK